VANDVDTLATALLCQVFPAFGMAQAAILVGPLHRVIRVIHLLMGLITLGTADALAKHVLATRR
jgi:hypothetical protein